MSTDKLLHPPLPPAPWHVTSEHHGRAETSVHTLRYTLGGESTPIESRTGPHGQSLLIDIAAHLNQVHATPGLKAAKTPATAQQSNLFH